MDNDDARSGRLLTRRELVELLGAAGAAALLAYGSGQRSAFAHAMTRGGRRDAAAFARLANLACVVRPELTEGPYFVDKQLDRSDIRAEPSSGELSRGVPLDLAINVSSVGGSACAPLAGAVVDVWQCDAAGVYSGVEDRMIGFNTLGKSFLRGFQRTDSGGLARFTTVYPGWYPGRAVHIHFKIRTTAAGNTTWEFTSQFFFDDAISDQLFLAAPYNKPGRRDTRNGNDGIYRQGGSQLLLAPTGTKDGLRAAFNIGLDLADAAVGRAARGSRRRAPE